MRDIRSWATPALSSMVLLCCAQPGDEPPETSSGHPVPPAGELAVALEAGSTDHGVTAVRVDLVAPEDDCTGTPLASQTLATEAAAPFSDAGSAPADPLRGSFALPPGDVRVCIIPLAGDAPSDRCLPGEQLAHVVANETTIVSITLQCRDQDQGVVQTEVSLNEAPRIESVTLDPAATLRACEDLTLGVNASDADGDALDYQWTLGDPLRLRPYEGNLEADGLSATFSANLPGTYRVNLTVDDGHGGQSSTIIPIEVTTGTCD